MAVYEINDGAMPEKKRKFSLLIGMWPNTFAVYPRTHKLQRLSGGKKCDCPRLNNSVSPRNNLKIQARMVRARHVGDGIHRRLQHANNKLHSVRGALAQARHLGSSPLERFTWCVMLRIR